MKVCVIFVNELYNLNTTFFFQYGIELNVEGDEEIFTCSFYNISWKIGKVQKMTRSSFVQSFDFGRIKLSDCISV